MNVQSAVSAQREHQAAEMLDRLRHALPSMLVGYPVEAAYVYGSVAGGRMTPFSDVDDLTEYRIVQEGLDDLEEYVGYILDLAQDAGSLRL